MGEAVAVVVGVLVVGVLVVGEAVGDVGEVVGDSVGDVGATVGDAVTPVNETGQIVVAKQSEMRRSCSTRLSSNIVLAESGDLYLMSTMACKNQRRQQRTIKANPDLVG